MFMEANTPDHNVTVLLDRTLSLNCLVTGHPAPRVTWTKDGLNMSTVDYRMRLGGQRLDITGAVLSDAGLYSCVASNAAGQSRRDYQLSVLRE